MENKRSAPGKKLRPSDLLPPPPPPPFRARGKSPIDQLEPSLVRALTAHKEGRLLPWKRTQEA